MPRNDVSVNMVVQQEPQFASSVWKENLELQNMGRKACIVLERDKISSKEKAMRGTLRKCFLIYRSAFQFFECDCALIEKIWNERRVNL